MSKEIITTTGRGIQTITTEIRTLTQQAQHTVLSYAIEIGRRLCEAKELVPHGEWGEYLKNEVEYSESTARNFMQVYKEYGSDQASLFAANQQALGNISYTNALRLLAIPAEEREDFARENNVEALSSRELEKLIAEKKEAEAAKRSAEQKAADAMEDVRDLANRLKTAEKAEADAKENMDSLRKKLEASKKAEADAKKKLAELKENPQVPEAVMEKLRGEAEADAAAKAREEMQGKVEAAERAAKKAAADKEEFAKKLAAVEKANQLSNPDAAVFKAMFEQVQADFNRLHGAWMKVQAADPALGQKLNTATLALLDKLKMNISA